MIQTLKNNKGKAAAGLSLATLVPLLYGAMEVYHDVKANKAALVKAKDQIWESVPASVYYSNLMEIRMEIEMLKRSTNR